MGGWRTRLLLEQIWSCSLRDCSALQCLWLMEVEEFMWVPKYTSSAAVFLSEPGNSHQGTERWLEAQVPQWLRWGEQ